eukprot:1204805-Rhodomonas_salina.2
MGWSTQTALASPTRSAPILTTASSTLPLCPPPFLALSLSHAFHHSPHAHTCSVRACVGPPPGVCGCGRWEQG